MTGSMLADLGVKNLADENPSLLKDFSLESIIEMNPTSSSWCPWATTTPRP